MQKKSINKKINKNLNGFSMMEVVLAVFLISTGLIAAVQLVSVGLTTSIDSRDQVIASELAQEGVELVRNIRDNNWANSSPSSFTNITTGNNCIIDKTYTSSPIACGKSTNQQQLYLDSNFYVHTGTTATKFHRKLNVTPDGVNNKKISSIVYWGGTFPTSEVDCNLINKCVYTQITLTTWGE